MATPRECTISSLVSTRFDSRVRGPIAAHLLNRGANMGYRLADHLSYCLVGDIPIFLDLQADRYVCLSESAKMAFESLVESPAPSAAMAPVIERLEASGLLQYHKGETRLAAVTAQSVYSEADLAGSRTSSQEILAAFGHVCSAELQYKKRSLLENIVGFQARKARAKPVHSAEAKVRSIAQAHRLIRRIVPSTDRCLQRSLALAGHLAAVGIPASLIFGVTLAPFSAHCWVQYGSMVLNDRMDHVAQRSQILVI